MAVASSPSASDRADAPQWPRLMINASGTVVFFEAPCCGCVIYAGKSAMVSLGTHAKNWVMTNFEDYEGKITLENIK